MPPDLDFQQHIKSESARFRDALADADPAAPVPTCPDWNAADLLWHLTEVQLEWGIIVRDELQDPEAAEAEKPQRPADYRVLLELFDQANNILVHALSLKSDDTAVWTWFEPDQSAGFVRRRQAHEALIHRLDAELTTGTVTDIDPQLATDGVKEVLDWMYSGVPSWGTSGADGPVGRIATTDTGASWLVRIGSWSGTSPNSGKTYSDEPNLTIVTTGDPAFGISGTAADLDSWLWNRPPHEPVALDGDYRRFESIIRQGVQ
jgi:uncharacterized protein (TIGR03083 family)